MNSPLKILCPIFENYQSFSLAVWNVFQYGREAVPIMRQIAAATIRRAFHKTR
jgi:hypothetical protein